MHFLFQSQNYELAARFRDYIQRHYSVEISIDKNEFGDYSVYCSDTSELEKIQQETIDYSQDPTHSRYTQASWEQGETVSFKGIVNFLKPMANPEGNVKNSKRIFTIIVAVFCILIYLACLNTELKYSVYELFHYPDQNSPDWQVWRYVSHAFVHITLYHIIFNLMWWWLFAQLIEEQMGARTLIPLTFLSAGISGFAQNVATGAGFFGLSCVVYAVLAYVWIANLIRPNKFDIPQGFLYILIVGILLGFAGPLIGIAVGNTAHITGAIVGSLFAFVQFKLIPYKKA